MSGTLPRSDLARAKPSTTLQRSTQNYTVGKESEIEIEVKNARRGEDPLSDFQTRVERIEAESAEMRRQHFDLSALFKKIETENAEIRRAYLDQTKFLDPPKSLRDRLEQWKRERKIFAVRDHNANRYPVFQFENGYPKPVINKILKAMPGDISPWQTALWFRSGNGWLSGDVPQNCLGDIDRVVNAAARLAQPAFD